jgi:hypothetical protein
MVASSSERSSPARQWYLDSLPQPERAFDRDEATQDRLQRLVLIATVSV